MSDVGELLAGRYRLRHKLGSGAMGVVWLAHDERLRRQVAVKQLLPQRGQDAARAEEARQRAMREGRVAGRLHHPNAVALHDVTEHDGLPVLVMEYMPSRSLADVLTERGTLAPEEVASIGAQTASALAAAHEAGIVHRDVKPGNVLLGNDGTVKITDFGISHAAGDIAVTQTGLLAGTPAFLSPEVARGHQSTPASDTFSLGATLYAAVEGRPPFGEHSENSLAVLHEVAAGHVPPPQHAGPLAPLLAGMMHTDPAQRLTLQQVREGLQAVAEGQPWPTAITHTPPEDRTQPLAQDSTATTAMVHPSGGSNGTRVEERSVAGPSPGNAVAEGPPTRSARTARRSRKPLYIAAAVAAALLASILLTTQGAPPAPPPRPSPAEQVPPPAGQEEESKTEESEGEEDKKGKGEEDKKGEKDKKGEDK